LLTYLINKRAPLSSVLLEFSQNQINFGTLVSKNPVPFLAWQNNIPMF